MADPVTWLIIGGSFAAVGSLAQGAATGAELEFDAAVAEQNAVLAEQDAAFAEGRLRRESGRAISAQAAATGASGIAITGSPLEVMMDTAVQAEIDALNIRRRGEIEAGRFRAQAAFNREAADSAALGGLFGAGASLFTGFGLAGLAGA